MDQLLDFSRPLDVKLLDQATSMFYVDGNKQVEQVLVAFRSHPLAWTRVDQILDNSSQQWTRMLATDILTDTVQTKWAMLPQQQKEGIKSYIVALIIKLSSTPQSLQANGPLLKKLDLVLVAIVKQEWPTNWPNFIPELVESSKSSQSLCANNMQILLLLSEEIFDYSHGQMTSEKMKEMKKNLNKEFTLIFQLCEYILSHSTDATLLLVTLQTLQRFLHWIPVGYIFETNLIDTLALKFFPVSTFQNETLQCLSEIGGLTLKPEEETKYQHKFISLFFSTISAVNKLIGKDTDVAKIYDDGGPTAQDFIRYLTIFITSFLRSHLDLLEQRNDETRAALLSAMSILLKMSKVEEIEIFKICLDYWNTLVTELYSSTRLHFAQRTSQMLSLAQPMSPPSALPPRIQFYAETLHQLRLTLISRMGKPEEVLIVEDDAGNIVRELLRDSDSVVLYKSMREALIYLTHLDPKDTQDTMLDKLSAQVSGVEWSWHNLNTLCWAIGSISGALQEDQEKKFLVRVIKDLLHLVELKRGKEHKAVIASNIMYIVGQYPRFLKQHWKFLKTVVNKLFEFMHESHPGVQDMSVDTFVKIAKKCKRKFVQVQTGETRPFIVEIVENLSATIADLEGSQIQVFYEACAEIISAETESDKSQQLLQRLMAPPNQTWTAIITAANADTQTLVESKTVKQLVMVLKTNSRVAQALGHAYLIQLGRLYVDMLQVYVMYSQYVSSKVAKEGVIVTRHADVRGMRTVKKEVLNLINIFVSNSSDGERDMIYSRFLPALMEPVLDDYKRNVPDARETEVLTLFAELCRKLNELMIPHIPRLFDSLFSVTLEMITRNFTDYPEHRLAFFNLLHSITRSCFPALLRLSAQQFQLVMDSILWAMKHLDRSIAEVGLETLLLFLNNISKSEVANHFYSTYFISVLSDLLGLITDTLHKPGLRLQSLILQKLFSIVESGSIAAPLWLSANNPIPGDYANNQSYVRQYVCVLLKKAFDHVSTQQIQQFTNGLFLLHAHEIEFKNHLRDFLITLKEFQQETPAAAAALLAGLNPQAAQVDPTQNDLFADERAKQEQAAKEEERRRLEQVPGLLYIPPKSHLAPSGLD